MRPSSCCKGHQIDRPIGIETATWPTLVLLVCQPVVMSGRGCLADQLSMRLGSDLRGETPTSRRTHQRFSIIPNGEAEVEIRKLMDVEDFGDAFTPNPEIANVKFK